MPQATIARAVEAEGIGLHGGRPVRLRLEPARSGGRVFETACGRTIPATLERVSASARATILSTAGPSRDPAGAAPGVAPVSVGTVEHLLAVLYVEGIDHVRIHVDGPELPAFDGSAAPVVALVERAGREALDLPAEPLRLAAPIEIREGDRWLRAEPADAFAIAYEIDYAHPAIGRQRLEWSPLDVETFRREIAPARTFGFLDEVEALRAAGQALGGSLQNAIVLDETGILNGSGLRFPDEFVRHKAIDLLGDLALLGRPLLARVEVEKGGHRLHHALARAIAAAAAPTSVARSPRARGRAEPSATDR